jgi:hypothetical protein
MVACMPTANPRNVRGVIFDLMRDFVAARVPGGFAAVERQLAPTSLADFFYQGFDIGRLYDPAPMLAISAGAARAMSLPHFALVRAGARWAATRDVRDPKKPRVAGALGPELAISRLATMASHAFDLGPIALQRVSPTHVRAMARNIPAPIAEWFVACVEGAVPATLEKCQVVKPEVQTRAPLRSGDDVTVIFEIRWS